MLCCSKVALWLGIGEPSSSRPGSHQYKWGTVVCISAIFWHTWVLLRYSKGSDVKGKHFSVGVHKMPSLKHTERPWKLCAGHHPHQKQDSQGCSSTSSVVGYFMNWSCHLEDAWVQPCRTFCQPGSTEFPSCLFPTSATTQVFTVALQQSTGTQVFVCFWG